MPRRAYDHSPALLLSTDERHAALVRVLASVLVRLAQRRHGTTENPAERGPHLAQENPSESGVSGLACAARKSVHVQGS